MHPQGIEIKYKNSNMIRGNHVCCQLTWFILWLQNLEIIFKTYGIILSLIVLELRVCYISKKVGCLQIKTKSPPINYSQIMKISIVMDSYVFLCLVFFIFFLLDRILIRRTCFMSFILLYLPKYKLGRTCFRICIVNKTDTYISLVTDSPLNRST